MADAVDNLGIADLEAHLAECDWRATTLWTNFAQALQAHCPPPVESFRELLDDLASQRELTNRALGQHRGRHEAVRLLEEWMAAGDDPATAIQRLKAHVGPLL